MIYLGILCDLFALHAVWLVLLAIQLNLRTDGASEFPESNEASLAQVAGARKMLETLASGPKVR